jgi:hypothetical protein
MIQIEHISKKLKKCGILSYIIYNIYLLLDMKTDGWKEI